MNIKQLNKDYLNKFLDKISRENKTTFPLGDFNINLLNCHIYSPTDEFVNLVFLINLFPIYYSLLQ